MPAGFLLAPARRCRCRCRVTGTGGGRGSSLGNWRAAIGWPGDNSCAVVLVSCWAEVAGDTPPHLCCGAQNASWRDCSSLSHGGFEDAGAVRYYTHKSRYLRSC